MWHDGLIFKLEQNGISGNLLRLLQNYLNTRIQRLVINGSYSDYSNIESGAPQGSVLGPLLFLVYINDLERNIKARFMSFKALWGNWGGNHYLFVVGVGAFCKYIRL